MNPTPSLFSFFLLQFHYRQNELFTVPVFNFFLSAVSDCIECSQKASCCVLVLIFLQFHIVSDTVRKHHLPSLFSKLSLKFHIVSSTVKNHPLPSLFSIFFCSSKSFQMPQVFAVYRLCFQFVLCSFKSFQSAPFAVSVFKIFSAVPNRFKCHQNAPFTVLMLIFSLQFRTVAITTRMHNLLSLFSKFSLQYQIVSKCSLYRLYFYLFIAVSNAVRSTIYVT